MMAYPAILDKVKGTPVKVRREGREGGRKREGIDLCVKQGGREGGHEGRQSKI